MVIIIVIVKVIIIIIITSCHACTFHKNLVNRLVLMTNRQDKCVMVVVRENEQCIWVGQVRGRTGAKAL